MSERFSLQMPATGSIRRASHVGVVASGDLEVLLEPAGNNMAEIMVHTKVTGHRKTWEAVMQRFFARHDCAMRIEIRDGGATPGTVWLRLEQALELAQPEVKQ